jgi:hypothetical protein
MEIADRTWLKATERKVRSDHARLTNIWTLPYMGTAGMLITASMHYRRGMIDTRPPSIAPLAENGCSASSFFAAHC